jgi:hypothetical protein
MDRIKLTKREKRVLRTLSRQVYDALSEFDAAAIRSLDHHGLVQGTYIEGGGVEGARLTNYGKEYVADNPRLRNPVDWKWAITTILAAIAAAAAVAALFVACSLT